MLLLGGALHMTLLSGVVLVLATVELKIDREHPILVGMDNDFALYLGHPITNVLDVSHEEQFAVQRASNETQP
jgi:hypothetical protein